MTTEAMVESTALMEVAATFQLKVTSAAGFPRSNQFVEVTDERIEDHIEQKSADGCKQCPFEDLFLIGLLVDFNRFCVRSVLR